MLTFCLNVTPAKGEDKPADAIGSIEGEAISVEGPMTVEVIHGQVRTILRSGSDVRVKSGQARIDLVEGGYIGICGPAHFSVLKAGGAITLALDSGTIHAQIGSEVSLNVYTPQIQAHPISIGNGVEDVLVGLESSGTMCVRAAKGAVRVEQQLSGQSVIVPQNGDITLANGQIESLQNGAGHCVCEVQMAAKPASSVAEVSQLATKEDLKKKATDLKPVPTKPATQAADPPEEPVYQIFMPPLQYDAKNKVQSEFDPNLVILVRRVRLRPTLIYQGRVEGDPVVAQAGTPTSPAATKPQAPAPKPQEESTWSRVRTYLRRLWSPTT
jgi:hypothetical protein